MIQIQKASGAEWSAAAGRKLLCGGRPALQFDDNHDIITLPEYEGDERFIDESVLLSNASLESASTDM